MERRRSGATFISMMAVVLIGVIAIGAMFAFIIMPTLNRSTTSNIFVYTVQQTVTAGSQTQNTAITSVAPITSVVQTTGCPAGNIAVALPIKFLFYKAYQATGSNSYTPSNSASGLSLLDPLNSYNALESNDASSGAWTTGNSYMSNRLLYLYVGSSDNTKVEFQFTVPCEAPTVQSTANHIVSVYLVPYPNTNGITVSVTDQSNNIYASGASYTVNTAGYVVKPTFTLNFANGDDANGWPGSATPCLVYQNCVTPASISSSGPFQLKQTWDTQLGAYRTMDLVIVVKAVGSGSNPPISLVNTWPQIASPGNTVYYGTSFMALTPQQGDMALDRYKLASGSYQPGKTGTYNAQFQIDASAYTTTITEVYTVYLYFYGDLNYLAKYRSINSESVAAVTWTLNLKHS